MPTIVAYWRALESRGPRRCSRIELTVHADFPLLESYKRPLRRLMAQSTSAYHPSRSSFSGEVGGRVCNLDFRPSRFFGCRIEKVLAEFFCCEDKSLAKMPEAIWDLTRGVVRPGLDDRALVEAAFSPRNGQGRALVSLYYRLPSVDATTTERILTLLGRRSNVSGYYRFGSGESKSLRANARVRTSVVGHDSGESLLVTSLVLNLRVVEPPVRLEQEPTKVIVPWS